jgi:selenide,water dikinase
VISTGIKFGKANEAVIDGSVKTMLTPGKFAAEAMRDFDVKGATDVTGFALVGHAWEMACASKVTIEIDSSSVPFLEGAMDLAKQGLLTSGDKTNRDYVGDDIQIAPTVSKEMQHLLFDPQTAGGMLIAVPLVRSEELLAALRANYPKAAAIGKVREFTGRSVSIV